MTPPNIDRDEFNCGICDDVMYCTYQEFRIHVARHVQ